MGVRYHMAFACLSCCKSFKRHVDVPYTCRSDVLVCPDCGGLAYNFGRHFKAPKKTDIKQWVKIRYLFDHGFRFQRIHTPEGVAYPETLEEAKEFVVKYQSYAGVFKDELDI